MIIAWGIFIASMAIILMAMFQLFNPMGTKDGNDGAVIASIFCLLTGLVSAQYIWG